MVVVVHQVTMRIKTGTMIDGCQVHGGQMDCFEDHCVGRQASPVNQGVTLQVQTGQKGPGVCRKLKHLDGLL